MPGALFDLDHEQNLVDALYHRSLIEDCLGNGKAAARYATRVRSLDPTSSALSAFRLR